MAQQIVTLCDVHLADGLEEPGRPWSVTIHLPGGKPTSYTLDVCNEHSKPLAELNAYLHELGRPAGTVAAASGPGAECPECGKVLKDRNGLSAHVRRNHGVTLTELETGTARGSSAPESGEETVTYTCPECGDAFSSPQGIGVHRSKKHGVPGAKSGKAAS